MANMKQWIENVRRRNPLGAAQAGLLFLSVLCGFFVCVPIGITLRNFHGRCILFAEVTWSSGDTWGGSAIFPWMETSCDFVLYMTLGACMIYALCLGIFMVFLLQPRVSKLEDSVSLIHTNSTSYMLLAMNPVFTLINVIITILTLSSATLVTVGFAFFCDSLEKSIKQTGMDFNTCYDAQKLDWTMLNIVDGTDTGVNGENFHVALTFAVIFSWMLFAIWLLQVILNFSQICRGCSCEVAEEKQTVNKSQLIAARRSRMQTPIGTPGGRMTPQQYMPPPGPGPRGQPQQYMAQAHMGAQPHVVLGPVPGSARA